MAVSRGVINHALVYDFKSLFLSIFSGKSLNRPSPSHYKSVQELVGHFFDVQNVEFFAYARSAFHALLVSLELPPGSQILLTPFNIAPMLDVVYSLGHTPIFVDLNVENFGPDYTHLELMLKQKPACFLHTHLFGYVADMDLIVSLCAKYSVTLLEDISQSIGATCRGKSVGTFGLAAFYSCSLTKYVDSYSGAFAITSDRLIASRLRSIRLNLFSPESSRIRAIVSKTLVWNIALNSFVFSCFTYPLLVLLKRLNRSFFDSLLGPATGTKLSHLNDVLPSYYFESISTLQLDAMIYAFHRLSSLIARRRRLAEALISRFPNIFVGTLNDFASNVYWQLLIPVSSTHHAREMLFSHGLETGTTNLPDLSRLVPQSAALVNVPAVSTISSINTMSFPFTSPISIILLTSFAFSLCL